MHKTHTCLHIRLFAISLWLQLLVCFFLLFFWAAAKYFICNALALREEGRQGSRGRAACLLGDFIAVADDGQQLDDVGGSGSGSGNGLANVLCGPCARAAPAAADDVDWTSAFLPGRPLH